MPCEKYSLYFNGLKVYGWALARGRKIDGVNRQRVEMEDLEIARSYVKRTTGRDIAASNYPQK